jgi:hypothetical protein
MLCVYIKRNPMARQEHVLSVFVASPSDVEAERGKLEDVIRELNITWSRDLAVRLDLVRWETHAYPGIGVDAQDVINNQILDDYDLFVGIMWCRYGTPTGRAGSGTVEEFDRARARYDSDPKAVKLMVYFKDEAIPPSRLDPGQLAKVNEFRDSLGADGSLYWKFSGIDQFEQLIRLHLTRQVQAWMKHANSPETTVESYTVYQEPTLLEDEEEGILDLMEVFEDKFSELTEISQRIANATEEFGQKLTDRSTEILKLPRDVHGNANRKDAKRMISRTASDMTQYTTRITAELPLFRDTMNVGINSFIKAATMSVDLKSDDDDVRNAKEGLEALSALRGMLATSKQSINEFQTTLSALPKMTTDLNKARRGVSAALESLLVEFANNDMLLSESEKVISDLLGK